MNYYERHIGDYLKDTAHLSLLEHGIYARLLDVYYTREQAIPDAQIARLIGARTKDEVAALRCVLAEFFVQEPGGDWTQPRCEREIERYQRKAEHNREVGKLGGRPKKTETQPKPPGLSVGSENETHAEPKPNPPRSQEPVTISSIPSEQKRERASRLPADWVLPDEWRSWAMTARPDLDPEAVACKFADYWHAKPGKAGTKLDWQATWRNWVREEKPPRTAPALAASQKTFRERDEDNAAARVFEMTGGLMGRRKDAATQLETIDANPIPRQLA